MAILFIGTFPPPIHGMSVMNQRIYNQLIQQDYAARKIDTAPKTLNRDILSLLSRIPRILNAWTQIAILNPGTDMVYIALSGGRGQIYDVVSIFLARLKRIRLVIHHHSFSYLNRKTIFSRLIFWMSRGVSQHVVLCSRMRNELEIRFGEKNIFVLSNLFCDQSSLTEPVYKSLRTVGYISNITRGKGGDIVLELAERIAQAQLSLGFLVAGPCLDPELSESLRTAESAGVIRWLGSVYGQEKQAFFSAIDVLVFPSILDEAEPLVVWEALSSGIPVIAYNRGCIGSQIGDAGLLVESNDEFVDKTIEILSDWISDPEYFVRLRKRAYERYTHFISEAGISWHEILVYLEKYKARK